MRVAVNITRLTARRRAQRGAVTVELAFVALVLLAMAFAVVEYTRAVYTYNLLVKTTRDAARYLSGFDPSAGADYPVDIAIDRMIWGRSNPGPTTPQLVPNLERGMVRVCDRVSNGGCPPMTVATATGSINLVRVEITGYRFQSFFPLPTGLSSFTFEPISTTMRQVL